VNLTIDESPSELSGTLSGIGLRNAAPITVTLTSVSKGSTAGTCTTTTAATTYVDADTATASCSIPNVPVDVYEINATIGGNYFQGSGLGALTVYDPTLGFTTGGGWYTMPDDTTSDPTDIARVNFGFNAKVLKSGQTQGALLTIVHTANGNYEIKSNAMNAGLAIALVSGRTYYSATFTGKATYAVPPKDAPLWCGDRKCGGYAFTAYVEDQKEPGMGYDRFWIEVKDPTGVPIQRISLPRLAADYAKVILGGNIQVPQPQGGK
jgi:hypothetical protein